MTQPTTERRGVLSPTELDKLVEKVYRLMLADLRLELARSAASPRKEGYHAAGPR